MPLSALALSSAVLMALLLMVLPAQDLPGALTPGSGLISTAVNAGTAGILLWIWWKTFQAGREEAQAMRRGALDVHENSVSRGLDLMRALHDDHAEARRETRRLLKEQNETQHIIAGTLTRIETKLDSQNGG